jgi:hypothetical protein
MLVHQHFNYFLVLHRHYGHYTNTYKDFTYNDFTDYIIRCDITYNDFTDYINRRDITYNDFTYNDFTCNSK